MTQDRHPPLDHLWSLSDQHGLHEHARFAVARPEHGYCTDDNARLLAVATRAGTADHASELSAASLRFVLSAIDYEGKDAKVVGQIDPKIIGAGREFFNP